MRRKVKLLKEKDLVITPEAHKILNFDPDQDLSLLGRNIIRKED